MKHIATAQTTKSLTSSYTVLCATPTLTGPASIGFHLATSYKSISSSFTVQFAVGYPNTDAGPTIIWESSAVEYYDELADVSASTPFFATNQYGATSLSLFAKVTAGDNDSINFTYYVLSQFEELDIYSYRGAALQTADDIADKILLTPANLLATDANNRVDIGALGGSAQSLVDLKDLADTGYNPTTHLVTADTTRIGGNLDAVNNAKTLLNNAVNAETGIVDVNIATVAWGSEIQSIDEFKANVSSLATAANLATVDTVVDAIKLKTDNLPASPAAVGSQMALTAGTITSIQTGLATASALTTVNTTVDTISSDVTAVSGKADEIISDIAALSFLGSGSVSVNHNYGSTDALTYKTSGGIGIDNAEVRAYLKTDYDAGNNSSSYLKGITTTDVNGQWENTMRLDPGTYTIEFVKQGYYGPDTQEITVS